MYKLIHPVTITAILPDDNGVYIKDDKGNKLFIRCYGDFTKLVNPLEIPMHYR
jgi:hypothetical protein